MGKYAESAKVHVRVGTHDGHLLVRVVDEGVGGADVDGGSGLRGLRDRVEALGGCLSIDSPRGGGTAVVAVIPTTEDAGTVQL